MQTVTSQASGSTRIQSSREPVMPVPIWVPLVLLLDAGLLLYFLVSLLGSPSGYLHLPEGWVGGLAEAFYLLSYAATGLLLLIRPRPVVAGFAAGLALISMQMLVLLASLMWGDGNWLLLVALANLGVCVWLVTAMFRHRGRVGQLLLGGVLGVFSPIVAVWIGGYVGTPLDSMASKRGKAAERDLVRDVISVQQCAFSWADAHPEGAYPSRLEELGSAGSGCLERSVERRKGGRALRYTPLASQGTDFDAFEIEGQQARGRLDSLYVFGDDLGLLARWAYKRSVHSWDRTDGIPGVLGDLRDCLDRLRSAGGLPATASELARVMPVASGGGCEPGVARYLGDSALRRDLHGDFRFAYAATEAGYRLEARPTSYGETALRSYLMTDLHAIHVTLEDRPAAPADWRLADCLPHDIGDCVPTPATTTPRAAFLHDSVVDVDEMHMLHIRVEGDTTRTLRRVSWAADCNVPANYAELPVPDTFREGEHEFRCGTIFYQRLSLEDRVIVRLWLKGRDGTIAWQQDTIRVNFPPGRLEAYRAKWSGRE